MYFFLTTDQLLLKKSKVSLHRISHLFIYKQVLKSRYRYQQKFIKGYQKQQHMYFK